MKNAMFMILGGLFVVVCLLCYLGPRTLEAFIDPPQPEPAPVDKTKYTKTGEYTLDRRANVLFQQKAHDNTQLKRIRDMFLVPNVVEGMDGCGEFGCCEKLGIAKLDATGSNCNGYCSYTDKTDTTPTSGPVMPPKIKCPGTEIYMPMMSMCPVPQPPPAPATTTATVATVAAAAAEAAAAQPGSTDTVFIAPPKPGFGAMEMDRLQPYKRRRGGRGGKCGTCPEPQPCPACARCPEPSFDCKKVPNYASTNSEYLPMPILTDFSTFGM